MIIFQSGSGGLKQKDQLATIQKFKSGVYNVLVATCVGEEGLDIGTLLIYFNICSPYFGIWASVLDVIYELI